MLALGRCSILRIGGTNSEEELKKKQPKHVFEKEMEKNIENQ